jgi:cyclase
MFYKADPLIFDKARELRKRLTPSEQTFWLRLKEGLPEYKFRRQHPISIYVADYYCHKLKLVIEIDGSIHNSPEAKINDEKRQRDLENLGLTVVRFTNDQVKNDVEDVFRIIFSIIENLTSKNESAT